MSLSDSVSLTHKAKTILIQAKRQTNRNPSRLSASLSGPVRRAAWGSFPAFVAVGRPPGTPQDGVGAVVPSPSIFSPIPCKAIFSLPKSHLLGTWFALQSVVDLALRHNCGGV